MAKLVPCYLRVLEKHPLLTMSSTTGTLMATADAISQTVVERTGKFDIVRKGIFLAFGEFVGGPLFRGWYFSIDKIFGKTKFAPMKMMLADQNYYDIMTTNWKIWPAAQIINFTFVPLQHRYGLVCLWCHHCCAVVQHRVLFVIFVALFWNIYLAWKSETAHRQYQSNIQWKERDV